MKTTMSKAKIITAGAMVLFILSLIGTGVFYNNNKSLTKNLTEEKLKTEQMLSEKLSLQNEIENFRNQVNSLRGKNGQLDKILAETNKKLNEKEAEVNKIVLENGNIKMMKKQIGELTQMKKDFEKTFLTLNESIHNINAEKDALNQKIASLEEENKQLAANIAILGSMVADNYLVETSKRNIFGKEKLTVLAKKSKKMVMSFKVPENVAEKISFKITKPDGSLIDGKDKGIACKVVNNEDGLLAGISKDEIQVSKKIEMTYKPKEKLNPGIYKIELFNGEKYVGSCNVRLR